MSIEVTARHMNASEAKVHANEKAEKLQETFPRVDTVRVILDVEKHRCEAEVVVRGKNHIHVEASETQSDMVVAIDRAFDRAEKQLRKLRDKVQSHRGHPDEITVDPAE